MCLQFGFVIFWQKDFGAKAAFKMLVNFIPGSLPRKGQHRLPPHAQGSRSQQACQVSYFYFILFLSGLLQFREMARRIFTFQFIVKRVSWFRSSLLLRINNKHTYKY